MLATGSGFSTRGLVQSPWGTSDLDRLAGAGEGRRVSPKCCHMSLLLTSKALPQCGRLSSVLKTQVSTVRFTWGSTETLTE